MQNRSLILIAAVAMALLFGWWFLRDTRVEVSWEPDWPESVRVTGEAIETIDPGTDGKVSGGELARARERALWKAYYFAQLRAAEQLREMEIDAETVIRDLEDLDQELRTSLAATVKAAREVDRRVEDLDDAVKATVVVEIPAEALAGLREQLMTLVRSGRIKIERAPRQVAQRKEAPPPVEPAPEEPAPSGGGATPSGGGGSGGDSTSGGTAPRGESPPAGSTAEPPAEVRPAARPAPPPRPAPGTGAVIVLAGPMGQLNATPTLFDRDGAELGTAFDLPPERLAAGLRLVPSAEDADVRPHVGDDPRRYEASISMGDIFLRDKLDAQQTETFREWLRADRVVLVLGDVIP